MSAALDPQDPLPEGRWLFRRLFTWLLVLMCCALLGWIVHQLRGEARLVEVAQWLIGLIALLSTYYLIAPSAEHIVRLVQAGRTLRVPGFGAEAPADERRRPPRRFSRVDDPDGGQP